MVQIVTKFIGHHTHVHPPRARFENELSKVVPDLVATLRELLKKSGVGADCVEKVR